jgi:hypothetical protein
MSEKQFEERSLFKQFSRSFSRSSRSFFRRSRSSFEQERASSVVESKISDQELQRVVHNDSIENFVNHYVIRRFQSYLINNVEDYALWKSICYDFENFDLAIWNKLSQNNWNLVKRICYTQGFWLNHAGQTGMLHTRVLVESCWSNGYATHKGFGWIMLVKRAHGQRSCSRRPRIFTMTNEHWIKSDEWKDFIANCHQ